MDIRKHLHRVTCLMAGAILTLSATSSYGQLLFKPEQDQEWYGREGYYRYGRSLLNRSANPQYDEFGNYIFDGVRIYEWNELKINSKHLPGTAGREKYSEMYKTNPIDEGEYFRQYLNNLVVVRESTKSFGTRFIVGNEVRVKFSPLTIDMAAMNGVRWDLNFNENNLTFVSSRSDLPLWFARDFVNEDIRTRQMPVYLTGAHFERTFGVFNVAANYVNQYKTDSTQPRSFTNKKIVSDIRDSVTGQVSWNPETMHPTYMVVKLEDGSRHDEGGPRVYDIFPVISGQERRDLLVGITTGSWKDDFTDVRRTNNNPAKDFYENKYMLDPRRVPQYMIFDSSSATNMPDNYIMRRTLQDPPPKGFSTYSPTGKDYLEVNGGEYIQFWFQIPTEEVDGDESYVEDIKFRSLVGNDYKFSVSEIYDDSNASSRGNQLATYFYTAKEAPGNIQDMSNLDWVSFRYGQQTANMIMGLRVETHLPTFDMIAEFNQNFNWRQFPNPNAEKYRTDAQAYYINMEKKFGKLTVGTEYFKIDPEYSTLFENTDPAYFKMNALPVSSWASEFHADESLTGGNENPSASSSSFEYMNNTMVIDTVDDNDDKDRYPDFHMFSEVRDMNGVFPGLDENGNRRPDTNENGNLVPDYKEAFFLFNVDPDEYEYGDDFNQNGVIDEREDDDRPDYPYNRDTKGYHLFTSYGADTGMKYVLGFINFEEIDGGGKTDVRYGKVEYNKFIPFFANVNVASQLKKSKDSIEDNVFRHATKLSATLADSLTYEYNDFYSREGIMRENFYDPLEYRDSYVSTSMFETKLFRIPNLNIGIKMKYDWNRQNETSFQNQNQIIDRTQVLKAEYKYYLRNLLIQPQVKFLARKKTSTNRYFRTLHEQYFYPIIRVEYPLTFNTVLRAGAQGFPGLNSTVRDLVNSDLDYDTRDYLIMLSNRSLYNGYDLSLNFGYEQSWYDYSGQMRKIYNRTDKVIFIRLVVGMEPIS